MSWNMPKLYWLVKKGIPRSWILVLPSITPQSPSNDACCRRACSPRAPGSWCVYPRGCSVTASRPRPTKPDASKDIDVGTVGLNGMFGR